MAVAKEVVKRELILELDGGVILGKQTTVQKRYTNINIAATDDNLLSAGQILSGLQEKALFNILVRDTESLEEA